jgi:drug/metabolite transporter (DMT)-like permease
MHRLQADLLLLFAAAIWGTAFYFQKTAMDHIGPMLFLAARGALAALALAPFALAEAHRSAWQWPRGLTALGITAGCAFLVAGALQQTGLKTATVTNAGFLTALYVVITPLLSWSLSGTRPPAAVWPAVLLAFAGTWLLGGGTLGGFSLGDWLIAASAVFWALHLLVTGASVPYARPIAFTAIQFLFLAACALIAAVLIEPIGARDVMAALPAIAYVGILSSALTFTLLAVALRHTSAAEAAVLVSTETLFAALAGLLLLGERLAPVGWLGAGLMFAATLLVQLGPYAGRRRRTARSVDRP